MQVSQRAYIGQRPMLFDITGYICRDSLAFAGSLKDLKRRQKLLWRPYLVQIKQFAIAQALIEISGVLRLGEIHECETARHGN